MMTAVKVEISPGELIDRITPIHTAFPSRSPAARHLSREERRVLPVLVNQELG